MRSVAIRFLFLFFAFVLLIAAAELCLAGPSRAGCPGGNCQVPQRAAVRSPDDWPVRGPIRWTTGTGRWLFGFPARTGANRR